MSKNLVSLAAKTKYSTGCKSLDDLFGGYEIGTLHEFYGETKAGKTTLSCYVPIANIYLYWKEKNKLPKNPAFIVVDGDGGFDYDRALEVFEITGEPEKVVDLIKFYQPTEFDELMKIVSKEIPTLVSEEKLSPLLISVDPIVAIYRGIVLRTPGKFKMSVMGQYTGKIDLLLVVLRKLAVDYGCPSIITSWKGSKVGEAMGADEGEVPMIGGRAMGFLAKVVVELKTLEGAMREAVLWKHRSKPDGSTCKFRLSGSGVDDI